MNRRLIFVGLAGLSCVGGLAGLFCMKKRREKDMSCNKTRDIAPVEKELAERMGSIPEEPKGLSNREKKELQDRIRAMSLEEMCVIVDAIPATICLARIEGELKKAVDMRASIERAYEMVKQ